MFRDRHAVWHDSVVKEADSTSVQFLSVNCVLLFSILKIVIIYYIFVINIINIIFIQDLSQFILIHESKV